MKCIKTISLCIAAALVMLAAGCTRYQVITADPPTPALKGYEYIYLAPIDIKLDDPAKLGYESLSEWEKERQEIIFSFQDYLIECLPDKKVTFLEENQKGQMNDKGLYIQFKNVSIEHRFWWVSEAPDRLNLTIDMYEAGNKKLLYSASVYATSRGDSGWQYGWGVRLTNMLFNLADLLAEKLR